MSLLSRISEDIKTAQKAVEAVRLDTLRFLMAQLQNREIEKRGSGSAGPLTDEETLQVIQREAKKRREAIELYRAGNRADLATKEEAELDIISAYLPAQFGEAEIAAVIDRLVAKGPREFNAIMKMAMAELKGRADGKAVGEAIRAKL
ncbi:MAG: GatB/YqeY domain-containing protein [Patescibacteria group bacterium]